jgi:hypothetical protein
MAVLLRAAAGLIIRVTLGRAHETQTFRLHALV